MTTLREAAQQALESMERYNGCLTHFHEPIDYNNAITALRAALAEPVQEPVAKVIATAPSRIWLDLGFNPADEDITFDELFEATWSQDNATGWGIEYVRADLAAPPQRKPYRTVTYVCPVCAASLERQE